VHIPTGPFKMGSDKGQDAYGDEMQQHEVSLSAYWLGRYPVTVAQFRAYVEGSGAQPEDNGILRGQANHPVVRVTWHGALAYSQWLGEKLCVAAQKMDLTEVASSETRRFWEGLASGRLVVCLPSEAEWEKAARGVDGRIYPWGDDFDPDKANIDETGLNTTSPVGSFPAGASPYGLLDMSGNVWEWTRSLDKSYPYDPADGREALDDRRTPRVLRGGSFVHARRLARCAYRITFNPGLRYWYGGFRVSVSPSP